MRLTSNQRSLLRRAAAVRIGARHNGAVPCDGNEDRTARSLVRRGLAEWFPPGTRASLQATDAGRRALEFPSGRR